MSDPRITHHNPEHGNLRSYTTGFLLAVILTAGPFWLVMTRSAPAPILLAVTLALGAVQMLVHLHYFLHIDGSAEVRWNLIAVLLAAVIVTIVIAGSLWVIWELNARMMPQMMRGTG